MADLNFFEDPKAYMYEMFCQKPQHLKLLYIANNWYTKDITVNSFTISPKEFSTPLFYVVSLKRSNKINKSQLVEIVNNHRQHMPIKGMEIQVYNTAGFTKDCIELLDFKIAAFDINKEKDLAINTFNSKGKKEPSLELKAHNIKAYLSALKELKQYGKACVTQATGTGKSYIAYKFFDRDRMCKQLFLSPSNYINNQFKLLSKNSISVELMTYTKLVSNMKNQIQNFDYDMIVLDEYHRLGASEWGEAVDNFLSANCEHELLGTTATDIRYLDNHRDMSFEIFGKYPCSQLPLHKALASQILPTPKYIRSIFEFDNATSLISEKLPAEGKKKLEKIKVDWTKNKNIEHVIANNVESFTGKYIVFCDSYEQLTYLKAYFEREVAPKVHNLQKSKIDHNISTFEVYSDINPNLNANRINSFIQASNEDLSLLFAIDMLNEGLHLKDIKGAFLFRKTISPILYFQQLGRVFDAGANHHPIIFDFSDNIERIKGIVEFKEELDIVVQERAKQSKHLSLETDEIETPFLIIDNTVSLYSEINDIQKQYLIPEKTNTEKIGEVVKFKEKNGHDNVPRDYQVDGNPIGNWLYVTRVKSRKDTSSTLAKLLIEYGISLELPQEFEFENTIQVLEEYYSLNQHFDPAYKEMFKNIEIDTLISRLRSHYKYEQISDFRINKLKAIGFEFQNKIERRQSNIIKKWKKFIEQYGHGYVHVDYILPCGFPLGAEINRIRKTARANKCDQRFLDFIWELNISISTYSDYRIEILIAWLSKHKTNDYPDEDFKGVNLLEASEFIRKKNRKGKISEFFKLQLEKYNFDFDPKKTLENLKIQALIAFKNQTGQFQCVQKTVFKNQPIGVFYWEIMRKDKINKLSTDLRERLVKIGLLNQIN